jgi:hypothetical protein
MIVLKYHASSPSNFCCLRLHRSCNASRPNREVLKCPNHCFPNTAPKAARRLVERLAYARVWIQMIVELGPLQTGSAASWSENVPLSTLLIRIFRSAFVVSLELGLRPDSMSTMKAELTAENRPAWHSWLSGCEENRGTLTNIRSTSMSPLCLSRNSSSCCFAMRSYADQKREGASFPVCGKTSELCMVSSMSARRRSDLDACWSSIAFSKRQGHLLVCYLVFRLCCCRWIVCLHIWFSHVEVKRCRDDWQTAPIRRQSSDLNSTSIKEVIASFVLTEHPSRFVSSDVY